MRIRLFLAALLAAWCIPVCASDYREVLWSGIVKETPCRIIYRTVEVQNPEYIPPRNLRCECKVIGEWQEIGRSLFDEKQVTVLKEAIKQQPGNLTAPFVLPYLIDGGTTTPVFRYENLNLNLTSPEWN